MYIIIMYNKETAYVMITCEPDSEGIVLDKIRSIECVKDAIITYGNYDIVAEIEIESIESLRDVIIHNIRKIKNIRCTTTLMCQNGHT